MTMSTFGVEDEMLSRHVDGERAPAHQPDVVAARRAFLLASLAAAATSLAPTVADAAQSSDAERTGARIVGDFCASVSKLDPAAMRPFFADDVVYRMTETTAPIVGAEKVLETYKALNATSIEFKVLETLTAGPIVINRRIDRFVSPRSFTWEGVGVFFVKDGKIKEWSDYTIRTERG
jgi:limonene-1,2-epoxide hydrolase